MLRCLCAGCTVRAARPQRHSAQRSAAHTALVVKAGPAAAAALQRFQRLQQLRKKLDDSTPVRVGKGNAGIYEVVGGQIRPVSGGSR
jgi:hypothetical protein